MKIETRRLLKQQAHGDDGDDNGDDSGDAQSRRHADKTKQEGPSVTPPHVLVGTTRPTC